MSVVADKYLFNSKHILFKYYSSTYEMNNNSDNEMRIMCVNVGAKIFQKFFCR